MAMRVCELLAVPELDLEVVVDGDLERVIRWVHTTELADPTRYLQGGEVILTTGVWRDAGTTSTGFVAPLEASDVAALGYGLPQPDAVMPPDLIEACEAASLPLDPSFAEQKRILERCKGLFYACASGAEARRFNRLLIDAGLIKGL